MSKTSFGKLAIGVVALSGSMLAHAEPMLGILNGYSSSINFQLADTDNLSVLGKAPLRTINPAQTENVLFNINGPVYKTFKAVDLKWQGGAGFMWNGEKSYAMPTTEEIKAAVKPVLEGESVENAQKPARRAASEIGGIYIHGGPRFEYKFNNVFGGFLAGGVQGVVPHKNFKKPYGGVFGQVGFNLNINPSFSVEMAARGFAPVIVKGIKSSYGATFGLKYNFYKYYL